MTKDKGGLRSKLRPSQRTWILARHLEANKLGWSLFYLHDVGVPTYEKVLSKRLRKVLKLS